ncbi:MAG: EAL domain-containing protein [Zoogloeaceae bacterium]|nr:EAL domain-containing protein [Zoogloeaceae bacterium]
MLALVVLEFVDQRTATLAHLESQARVAAEGSAAAMVFESPASAQSTLESLSSLPAIRSALLYRAAESGKGAAPFAYYLAPAERLPFDRPEPDQAQWWSDLIVHAPVQVSGQTYGKLYLTASAQPIWRNLQRYAATVLLVASGALCIAYLLTSGLRRRITSAEKLLETRANFDELTGLPNRSLFNDRLSAALSEGARGNRQFAVLYCDLDNFKVVNDSLGHSVGDRLLSVIAERLQHAIRAEDTLCRLGGDEFLALIRGGGEDAATRVAKHIIDHLSKPYVLDEHTFSVGTSVGIAIYPRDGHNAEELLRAADTALYEAKSRGRSRWCLFSPKLDERAQERLRLESGLRSGFAAGQLTIHFQPQVNTVSRRVIGAEALLRWSSPEFGEVSPARFIPIAEQCGLIREIGAWVLDEACRQATSWIARCPDFVLSVNLSPAQLHDRELAKTVARCLTERGFPAARLELEITETALTSDDNEVVDILEELGGLGIRLSLDDFGTGYSSLGRLKQLPISRLKIDRSFVSRLPEDAGDATIVNAIIAMAKALSMEVIAEGVESEDQLSYLMSAGCFEAQGWLFGRAQTATQFEAQFLTPSSNTHDMSQR